MCFAESLITAATVESKDGDRVQEVGCSTSGTISNEHDMKVAAEALDENIKSAASSSQLQGDVENKVLGDSSLSTEKHSISVQAIIYYFYFYFYLYEVIVYICRSCQPIFVHLFFNVLVNRDTG